MIALELTPKKALIVQNALLHRIRKLDESILLLGPSTSPAAEKREERNVCVNLMQSIRNQHQEREPCPECGDDGSGLCAVCDGWED